MMLRGIRSQNSKQNATSSRGAMECDVYCKMCKESKGIRSNES